MRRNLAAFLAYAIALAQGCGYQGIDSDNGKLAVIQQANSFLTAGDCGQAIDTLRPLYQSRYVDTEVRLVLSSAYACLAGFSFPGVIGSLKTAGGDIFSTLVGAMYSNGGDSHLTNYQLASSLLRETSVVSGTMTAVDRPDEANVYMIFMQLGALTSLVSALGVATKATGHKTQAITGLGTNAEKCVAQVAIATVSDSINKVGSTGVFSSFSAINNLCGGLAGCGNLDPSVCAAANQTAGAAIFAAIDLIWQ